MTKKRKRLSINPSINFSSRNEFNPYIIELPFGGWRPAIVDRDGRIVEEGEYDYYPDERSAAIKEAKDLCRNFMRGKL